MWPSTRTRTGESLVFFSTTEHSFCATPRAQPSHTLIHSLSPSRKHHSPSLYIEKVDLGDPEGPRTIVSGLVSYVPQESLENRLVVALCNLKARNMRGVKSDGMLLCASNADHTAVEPLDPPEGSNPGDRLGFDTDGARPGEAPAPASPNQVAKKKVWEGVQPDLKTTADRVATWKGAAMVARSGEKVTCASLGDGNIS